MAVANWYQEYPEMLHTRPALKLVWLVLLLAIKDKAKLVTFRCKHKGRRMEMKFDNGSELIPPPTHLMGEIANILRRGGRYSALNPDSHFRVIYTETGTEKKVEWIISYDTYETTLDLNLELNALLQKIKDREDYQDQKKHGLQKASLRRKIIARTLITVIVISLLLLAIIL